MEWTKVWEAGGAEADSTLLFPVGYVVADSGLVVVPDDGAHRVVAFHTRDGSVAWRAGRKGQGPGEYEQFSDVALTADGGVVVSDRTSGRLTFLDRTGRFTRSFEVPGSTSVESVCPLEDGSLLVSSGQSGPAPLILTSADGRELDRFPVPWAYLVDEPSLRRQMHLGSIPGGCVAAQKMGNGFAFLPAGRPGLTAPYVEDIILPEVTVTRQEDADGSRRERQTMSPPQFATIMDPWVQGDTLFVPFIGTTPDAYRLVDAYRRSDGTYLFTYRLPFRVRGITHAGPLHFFLVEEDGYPTLLAYRGEGLEPAGD